MAERNLTAVLEAAVETAVAAQNARAAMKLAGPVATALFTATGEPILVSQIGLLPSFTGALSAVRHFFEGEWRAGDLAVTNDADAGAANACEMIVVMPVFQGKPTPSTWVAVRARVPDFGGWEMGGYSPQAVDRWAEGARIEPAKLMVGGEWRREVGDMLHLNSRTPKLSLSIIRTLAETARALAALAPDSALLAEAAAQRKAEAARIDQALSTVASGALASKLAIRSPLVATALDPIGLEIRNGNDRLRVAFAAPPPSPLPINLGRFAAADLTIAAVAAALDLPKLATGAILDRLDITIPEPSLLAAPSPATVGLGREITGQAIFRGVFTALAGGEASGADTAWQRISRAITSEPPETTTGKLAQRQVAAIRSLEAEIRQ